MNAARWIQKADALTAGWLATLGVLPPKCAIRLALCPAQHETRCGDAWPNEFNWGATTLRSLNDEELAVVKGAGLIATVGAGHETIADAAMVALRASGLSLPPATIHCDSRPGNAKKGEPKTVPYFTWFASFPDDAHGAAYFVKLLAGAKHPNTRAVLERVGSLPRDLAQAQYNAGYYTGFFEKSTNYEKDAQGKWTPVPSPSAVSRRGADLNVDAYGSALARIKPEIDAALVAWEPSEPIELPDPLWIPDGARDVHADVANGLEGLPAFDHVDDDHNA